MILIDTGPLVALFNKEEALHQQCKNTFSNIAGPWWTTMPVLTEAFYLLSPGSHHAKLLQSFLLQQAVSVFFFDTPGLIRSMQLMEKYADHPMDLADASLIVAAEMLNISRIFTLDHKDFNFYRLSIGHHHRSLEMIR